MALTKGSGFGVASSSDGGAATSGGTITAIASGALPNGKPVILQSDGTVKAVEGHSTGFGTPVAEQSSIEYDIQSNFLTADKSKVFISYRNSSTMYAIIGTIDGDKVTFGTQEQIGPSSTAYTSSTTDGAGNWVCTYKRYNYNDYPYAVVGTFSGTDTIQKSSATTLQTNTGSARSSCIYHPTRNRFYIVWSCYNGGFRTYSGVPNGATQPSWKSAGSIDSTNYGYSSYMWWDSTHSLLGIIYQPTSNLTYINMIDINSSGDATEGTKHQVTTNADSEIAGCHHSSLGLNVVLYKDGNDSNKSKIVTFDVASGSPSSVGNELEVIVSGGTIVFSNISIHHSSGTNTCYASFRNNNDSYKGWVLPITITGQNAMTVGTPSKSDDITGLGGFYDTERTAWDDTNKKLLVTSQGDATIWREAGSNVNADNFIGIPTEAVANGGSATVTVIGGVSENQSGLTIGKTYYISDDGTLSSTATTKPRAGIAIAANKLLVR